MSETILKHSAKRKRCPTEVRFVDHYPDENHPDAAEDIARTLAHVGVFDDLDKGELSQFSQSQ
jgi:hypothetical protein